MGTRLSRNAYICLAAAIAAFVLQPATRTSAQNTKAKIRAGWIQSCTKASDGIVEGCRLIRRVRLKSGPSRGKHVSIQIRLFKNEKSYIRIQLPAAVDLQSGVSLAVMDGTSSLSTLAYRSRLDQCNWAGCFAKLPLDDELLAALKTNKKIQIGFADSDDKKMSVEFSLRHFARAYQALEIALK